MIKTFTAPRLKRCSQDGGLRGSPISNGLRCESSNRYTPGSVRQISHDPRFIPAGAGNTSPRWPGRWRTPVHPRGCGEHGRITKETCATCGSSPRVRGTHDGRAVQTGAERFIPAGAGNTSRYVVPPLVLPVHPRGCGEHDFSLPPFGCIPGSSPRVRGTPSHIRPHPPLRRFIPAGAGNTQEYHDRVKAELVHPRGCGEHMNDTHIAGRWNGSSPRVRGTLGRRRLHRVQVRFIPAGAGNTRNPSSPARLTAVHPRGCGEHQASSRVR